VAVFKPRATSTLFFFVLFCFVFFREMEMHWRRLGLQSLECRTLQVSAINSNKIHEGGVEYKIKLSLEKFHSFTERSTYWISLFFFVWISHFWNCFLLRHHKKYYYISFSYYLNLINTINLNPHTTPMHLWLRINQEGYWSKSSKRLSYAMICASI